MATALQIVQKFYPQVKSIEDATKGINIEVTPQDARVPGIKNHAECAMAVACKRSMHADAAIICVKTSYIVKGNKAIRYHNPGSVAREIVSFDRKAGFEPGNYRLSRVPPSNRLGIERVYSKLKSPRPEPTFYHRTENVRVVNEAGRVKRVKTRRAGAA